MRKMSRNLRDWRVRVKGVDDDGVVVDVDFLPADLLEAAVVALLLLLLSDDDDGERGDTRRCSTVVKSRVNLSSHPSMAARPSQM